MCQIQEQWSTATEQRWRPDRHRDTASQRQSASRSPLQWIDGSPLCLALASRLVVKWLIRFSGSHEKVKWIHRLIIRILIVSSNTVQRVHRLTDNDRHWQRLILISRTLSWYRYVSTQFALHFMWNTILIERIIMNNRIIICIKC